MKVRFITPKVEPPGKVVWPPCQAQRANRYINDAPGKTPMCSLSARYDFDGVTLCQRHASSFALGYLVNQSQSTGST